MSFDLPPLGAEPPAGAGPVPRKEAEKAATTLEESAKREAAAERVHIGRQLLIDLDRRRHQTREAIRAVEKVIAARNTHSRDTTATGGGAVSSARGAAAEAERLHAAAVTAEERRKKSLLFASAAVPSPGKSARPSDQLWLLCEGDVFLQTNLATGEKKLRSDATALAEAVEVAQQELNGAVRELAELEGVDSAIGALHQGFNLKPSRCPTAADAAGSR